VSTLKHVSPDLTNKISIVVQATATKVEIVVLLEETKQVIVIPSNADNERGDEKRLYRKLTLCWKRKVIHPAASSQKRGGIK
jgi:hypothetical protein